MNRVLTQAAWEIRAILRNGEQLLVSFIMPLLALVILLKVGAIELPDPRSTHALAGALAMAVIASSFTSQAILLAFDRRWGVLRMFSTTPLGPRGLLGGKAVAVGVVVTVQALVLGFATAVLSTWRPHSGTALLAGALMVAVGTVSFVALAMCVGGTLRPEAVLAIANIAFVLMVVAGGVLVPLSDSLVGTVLSYTPFGALGEGMRAALTGHLPLGALLTEAAWALALGMLAIRTFRWES
ncbi:MAG: ABC transporter permease [Bowdeniella nasicola]|nr:ABC transporter permease [Bowdeniella nasicola]